MSLILVFVVSCGDTAKSQKQKNDGNTADTTDSADTGEEAEQTDHGDTVEPEEQTDPDNNTDHEGSQEKPDPDESTEEDSDEPQQNEEPAAEKFCQQACETASDCVQVSSNAVYDDDNYKCENGKCIYLGCLSDDECDEVYGAVTQATGKVYRCNKNGAYGYPECTPTCSSASDCDLYGQGTSEYAYDSDNYKCESGLCVYTGCLSDAECKASTYSDLYKCIEQDYFGKTLKICTVACQTADDCPEPGLYECRNSRCVTKSCESDEWCREYNENYSCL